MKLCNEMSEKAVLAGLCRFGSQAFFDIIDIVNSECFTSTENVVVFKCITEVLAKSDKADIATILSKGSSLGIAEEIFNQADYLKELSSYSIDFEAVRSHAKIIRKLDIARKAQYLAQKIYKDLQDITGEESIDVILSKIESPVINFSTSLDTDGEEKTTLLAEGIDDHIKNLMDNPDCATGVPTPWPIYNSIIGGGLRRGGVHLIAARPGTGKSTLSKNESIHYAMNLGIPVLYLDTEMRRKDQINRFIAALSHVNINDVEDGSFSKNTFQRNSVIESSYKLKKIPLYYRNIAGKKFEEVISLLRRWLFKDVGITGGVANDCVVVYDYFKLMDSNDLGKMQEYQVMGFQITELSNFCINYGVPCSAYVQLNRDGVTKESGDTLSQSDRLLWLATSCSIFKKKTPEEIATDGIENGNMKLITVKTRFGQEMDYGDYINMAFNREVGTIKEVCLRSELGKMTDGFETEDDD